MKKRTTKIVWILLLFVSLLHAQVNETPARGNGEFKMTFPSIYFKNNSTEYAQMPYTVDSCFKYLALHVKHLYSLDIWRDSSENEALINKRIKKLKVDLHKYTPVKVEIRSMGETQKISQRSIYSSSDNTKIQYLLSLNSVLDISSVMKRKKKKYHCLICKMSGHWRYE